MARDIGRNIGSGLHSPAPVRSANGAILSNGPLSAGDDSNGSQRSRCLCG
ncbi:hypothetical protein BN844_1651 [Pseudomonas sp. SHC52]|nr:hypothetical protein BN844_1651 [Pseudomonas sp. SHC52]